jgi:hypothetical protein
VFPQCITATSVPDLSTIKLALGFITTKDVIKLISNVTPLLISKFTFENVTSSLESSHRKFIAMNKESKLIGML